VSLSVVSVPQETEAELQVGDQPGPQNETVSQITPPPHPQKITIFLATYREEG
jgi:hypothetical protein